MTTAVAVLTAAEIVATYGIDRASLYVLAHRKKWRRIKLHGRVFYDLADVDKALGKDSPSP